MAKIPLTIDKEYCSGWGVWHGIRELIQNAKDADEYNGHSMVINHYPRTSRLEIINVGVQVDPGSLLVLGKTSKRDGGQRGKFGEGFVLGVLALVRAGHDVKFRNHEHSWTVAFESPDPGHPLAGNELLTFSSHKLTIREQDFKVEIDNIPTEVWDAIKKLVLFVEPPKAAETTHTMYGTMLLNPEYTGRIYVRGLFVRSFEDLSCGYDLENVQLDRDRQMIDEYSLHWALSNVWTTAYAKDAVSIDRIYEMAKAGAPETKNLQHRADAKLLADLKDAFIAEHGDRAVPTSTTVEARDAAAVGAKPAMVSTGFKEILASAGLSLEATKKKLEGTVEARFSLDDLVDVECIALERLEAVITDIAVVTFTGAPRCYLIDNKKVVGIDRRLLPESYRDVLTLALAVAGQRTGLSPFDLLLTHIAGPAVESKQDAPVEATA